MRISRNLSIILIACTFALFLMIESPVSAQADKGETTNRSLTPLKIAPQYMKSKPAKKPKFGKHLKRLFYDFQSFKKKGLPKGKGKFRAHSSTIRISDSYVVIDAIAVDDPGELKKELESFGLKSAAVFGKVVSGLFPMSAIDKMSQCIHLNFAQPSMAINSIGAVTSQGDVAMNAKFARNAYGVDGTGVKVGVLSDSYNCLGGAAADITSNDLPASGVTVLAEPACSGMIDEGRAMLQIIHDVAPGASLSVHTAFLGMANFAQGIVDLADNGAKVIVDDVIYFAEPMFQDGIIAQAVDQIQGMGVSYFSSAGNQSRKSYEADFLEGEFAVFCQNRRCTRTRQVPAHNFNSEGSPDIYQKVSIPEGGTLLLSLQWDSPAASAGGSGSLNDVDIYLTDDPPTTVLASSTDQNINSDPVEVLSFQNNSNATKFNLLIVNAGGTIPGKIKYVRFGQSSLDEYDTQSSTSYGHANAVGAVAVGAAYWNTPLQLETYSSVGGTPILFDIAGNRLPSPEFRFKPNVVGPDGGSTTFFYSPDSDGDGFPDFFGTSASAPHVAGVAALMLQADPSLLPLDIYSAMESTAVDMDDPSPSVNPLTDPANAKFDVATGYGFVQADAAIAAIVEISSAPSITPPPDMTVEATSTQTGVGNIGQATATDDVSAPENITIINNAPDTFPVGPTTVIWTATDEEGNSSTAEQIITIVDTTVPVVTAPSDLIVDSTGTLTTVDIGVAIATDALGTVLIYHDVGDGSSPPSFPVGETVVTWSAEDAAENIGTDTQIITVNPPANTAPTVSAGPDQTITLPASASLNGTVTDDAQVLLVPNLTWSKVFGPGTVTFANANVEDTTATFSIAGEYVLRLIAFDGQFSDSGEMTIIVNDEISEPLSADLSIRKVADQRRPRVGSTLIYTITVTNNGPDDATGIVVQDTLPSTVQFSSTSQECTNVGGTVTCNIDSINAGDAKSVNISVLLDSKGKIENRVTVSGSEPDPNLSNNQATRRTRVR